MSSFVAIFCCKCSNCARVTKFDVLEVDVLLLLEQMDLWDLVLSGITVMLCGMFGVLVEELSVLSNGGSGLVANLSGNDFMCAFFSLEIWEGVFDFCEDLEDFPCLDLDWVFGGPDRDFCDDLAVVGGIFY